MSVELIGLVVRTYEASPDNDGAKPGRLRPLFEVTRAGGEAAYAPVTPERFGAFDPYRGGGVVWFGDADLPPEARGQLVCCRADQDERHFGQDDHDWWRVVKTGQKPELRACGAFVVYGRQATVRGEPSVEDLPEGAFCYVTEPDRTILGPWKVGPPLARDARRRTLVAVSTDGPAGVVYRLGKDNYKSFTKSIDPSITAAAKYVMPTRPPPGSGEPALDAATPEQLTDWVIKLLRDAKAADALGRSAVQIRTAVRETLPGFAGRYDTAAGQFVAVERLARLDTLLAGAGLEADAVAGLVGTHPLFRAAAAATAEAATTQDDPRLHIDGGQIDLLRRQREALEADVRRLTEEKIAVENQLAAHWAKVDHVAAEVVNSLFVRRALERLTADGPGTDGPPARPGPVPPVTPAPAGPAIGTSAAFLADRLVPALQDWVPHATPAAAAALHDAVCGCRWTLVDHGGWAKAYERAMGGTATLTVVAAQSTWACAADAWDGGLGRAWRAAVRDPNRLHLILIGDLDLSVVRMWVRPWLDVIAGFATGLRVPADAADAVDSAGSRGGDETVAWPDNLRVLASCGAGEPMEPLPIEVCAHWAAVPRATADAAVRPSGHTERVGHVPLSAWLDWSGDINPADPATTAAVDAHLANLNGAGPPPATRRSVRADLARLVDIAARRAADPTGDRAGPAGTRPTLADIVTHACALRLGNARAYHRSGAG